MNNVLTSPIGIDSEIQQLQVDLYDALITKWVDGLDAYGRIYKNKDENDGTVYPQYHKGDGEYKKDVYHSDDVSGTFFFVDSDESTTEDGFAYVSIVKCVFMVDLKKILPNSVDRADQEAQRDVVELLREFSPGRFDIVEIEKGISNIFSGFNQVKIKDLDIQPYHCFSININLFYDLDPDCNILTT